MEDTQSIQIRPFSPDDEEQIVQLLRLGLDGWPRFDLSCEPLEHWGWKYIDNPLKTTLIFVAESEDKIVGCYHMVPIRIKICENILIWRLIADVVVHPEYRKAGIYQKMWEYASDKAREMGLNLSYWVSGNPIVIATSEKYPGFPYQINNFVRIRDISKQLDAMPMKNAWFYKLGFYASKKMNFFRGITKRRAIYWKALSVYETNDFTQPFNDFWNIISKHHDFILVRNSEYLNWRYGDPRAGVYSIRRIEKKGEILGFCVLKINKLRADYPIGFVVDMITLPDRLDVANRLIADAIDFFDSQNVNIVNCLVVKGHPFERIYRRHGFLDSRMNLNLFFGSPDMKEHEIELNKIKVSSIDRLHFSYGDIDSLPFSIPAGR